MSACIMKNHLSMRRTPVDRFFEMEGQGISSLRNTLLRDQYKNFHDHP